METGSRNVILVLELLVLVSIGLYCPCGLPTLARYYVLMFYTSLARVRRNISYRFREIVHSSSLPFSIGEIARQSSLAGAEGNRDPRANYTI